MIARYSCLWLNFSMGKLKHGLSDTPEYEAWRAMRNRCYKSGTSHFERYGGRGIKVCKEWMTGFVPFLNHVGFRPTPKHSIHRIDNNGNYEPGNVVWATKKEQCNLRKTIAQWAREVGLGQRTIWYRLRQGWTASQALGLRPQKLKRKMS